MTRPVAKVWRMSAHHLDRAHARRIAVQAQLLDDSRVGDLLSMVTHMTFLEHDLTPAIAPSADVVSWSRLKDAYRPEDLRRAVEVDRSMFEYRARIRPMADLVMLRPFMTPWGEDHPQDKWLAANKGFRADVLARLRHDGPLRSRDIPDTAQVPWPYGGTGKDLNVMRLLDLLAARGEVAVSARVGRQVVWDLAERVYPETPQLDSEEANRLLNRRRLASLGIARWAYVGSAGEPAVVEGVRGQWRVDPDLLERPFIGRTALLSPFDGLVQDGKRLIELFEYEYKPEMNVPKARRRWGYYALPVLHGDRLVGKVDARVERSEKILRVNTVHRDAGYTDEVGAAVNGELRQLADWLGVELRLDRPTARAEC